MKMDKNNNSLEKKYPAPFSIRLTKEERKSLEKAAAGRPLAAYIRWLIFRKGMSEMPKKSTRGETADKDHKEIAKLLGALGKSRIASNINQLAKAANSGSLPVNWVFINEASNFMRRKL